MLNLIKLISLIGSVIMFLITIDTHIEANLSDEAGWKLYKNIKKIAALLVMTICILWIVSNRNILWIAFNRNYAKLERIIK